MEIYIERCFCWQKNKIKSNVVVLGHYIYIPLNLGVRTMLGSLFLSITPDWSLPVIKFCEVLLSLTADGCISKESDAVANVPDLFDN